MSTPEGGDHLHRAKPVSGSPEPVRWSASSGQQAPTATTRLSGHGTEPRMSVPSLPIMSGEPKSSREATPMPAKPPPQAGRVTMVRLRPVVCETGPKGGAPSAPLQAGRVTMVRPRPVVCETGPKRGAHSEGGPADSARMSVRHAGAPTRKVPSMGGPADSARMSVRHAGASPTMKEGQRASCSRRGSAREELGAPGATANRSRGKGQGVEIPGAPPRRQADGGRKESRPSETPPVGDCTADMHRAKPASGSPEPVRWSASSGQQAPTATTRLSGHGTEPRMSVPSLPIMSGELKSSREATPTPAKPPPESRGAPSEGGPADSARMSVRHAGAPTMKVPSMGGPADSARMSVRHAGAPMMKEGQRASCSRRGSAREELGAPGASANRSQGEG